MDTLIFYPPITHRLQVSSGNGPGPSDTLPLHRMLYVQSRCEGKAQLHIAPRMDASSSRPYEDAEDILEHLKSVLANPNRKAEAYSAYHQLTMKPRDSFTDFLAEFLQLAEEACVVRENLKRDLYLKLPHLLQTQMMLAVKPV
jgi:hypothetical protein